MYILCEIKEEGSPASSIEVDLSVYMILLLRMTVVGAVRKCNYVAQIRDVQVGTESCDE